MPLPSWLLLAWSGFAAACAAAVFGTAAGGSRARPWALAPPRRRGAGAFGWHVLAGVLVYPVIYGIIFELAGSADVRTGFLIGLAHAALAFLLARPREDPWVAARSATAHLLYAVVLAFLYVTP